MYERKARVSFMISSEFDHIQFKTAYNIETNRTDLDFDNIIFRGYNSIIYMFAWNHFFVQVIFAKFWKH